jgi:hypothetical protein
VVVPADRRVGSVFDFGQNASNRLFAVRAATASARRSSTMGQVHPRAKTAGKPVPENQWVHVAVVLDPARVP